MGKAFAASQTGLRNCLGWLTQASSLLSLLQRKFELSFRSYCCHCCNSYIWESITVLRGASKSKLYKLYIWIKWTSCLENVQEGFGRLTKLLFHPCALNPLLDAGSHPDNLGVVSRRSNRPDAGIAGDMDAICSTSSTWLCMKIYLDYFQKSLQMWTVTLNFSSPSSGEWVSQIKL